MNGPPKAELVRRVGASAVHVSNARSGKAGLYDVSLVWPIKRPLWSCYYVLSDVEASTAEATAQQLREICAGIGEHAWRTAMKEPNGTNKAP